MSSLSAAALRKAGVPGLTFLSALHVLAEKRVTQTELREIIGVTKNTIVSLVNVLEKRRLIERHRANDRRYYTLSLTPKGRRLYLRATDAIAAAEQPLRQHFSRDEWEALCHLLEKLHSTP